MKGSVHSIFTYPPSLLLLSRRSSPSLEIPNLCIMPPMIKYSPACKSKSRRENPTLHTYIYVYIYTYIHAHTILSSRVKEAGQKKGFGSGNQNAKLFGFQLHGISEYPARSGYPGLARDTAEKLHVPPREISSKMACCNLQHPKGSSCIFVQVDDSQRENVLPLARDKEDPFSFLSFLFPLYPSNGISNSRERSWNGPVELDPNARANPKPSLPPP